MKTETVKCCLFYTYQPVGMHFQIDIWKKIRFSGYSLYWANTKENNLFAKQINYMTETKSAHCIFLLLADGYLTGPLFCLAYDWNIKENYFLSFIANIY